MHGRVQRETYPTSPRLFPVYLANNPSIEYKETMGQAPTELQTSEDKTPFAIKQTKGKEETILIVDDDSMVRSALEMVLTAAGFEVISAKNGEHALRLMLSAKVAVILCDEKMPGMSGTDVLKSIALMQPDAVRILMTAVLDETVAMNAINEGRVFQLLQKPWDEAHLIQMLKNALKQYHLTEENKRLEALLAEKQDALIRSLQNLRQEIKVASVIHETLLLGVIPKGIPGITIEATTIPSKDIDGDFFDFYIQEDKVFDLAIGDVMGKGITASVVGTAVKTHLLRYANPLPILYGPSTELMRLSPLEIVFRLDREISDKLMRLEYFVCLLYGRFDLQKQIFHFVNCGVPSPIHYSRSREKAAYLEADNFPIGFQSVEAFKESEALFSAGDLFVFCSDGVTEARSPKGEVYGRERLLRLINDSVNLAPQEIIEGIQDSILMFSEKDQYDDDLSLIVIKIEDGLSSGSIANAIAFRTVLKELMRLRICINERLREWHYHDEIFAEKLELAANEAFCNIVEHGYSFSKNGKILVEIRKEEKGVTLEFYDQGVSIDPQRLKDAEVAKEKGHSFGLYIIKTACDYVEYEPKTNLKEWNRLKLYKSYSVGG